MMPRTIHDQYLETEVFTAGPLKLVCILYRAAIEGVAAARGHLQRGEIRERSRRISKVLQILAELRRSLDHTHGAAISRNLDGIYAYMQGQLTHANFAQTDAPLAEVEGLLTNLQEAWLQIVQSEHREVFHEPKDEPAALSCAY